MTSSRSLLFLTIASLTLIYSACTSNPDPVHSDVVLDSALLGTKKYAFTYQQGDKTVISSADTIHQVSFGGATHPAIAPDGLKVAYTVKDSAGHQGIWVADLENKSQSQFNLPGTTYDEAIWSPSGNAVSFGVEEKGKAHKVGTVGVDNSAYLIIDSASQTSLYAATWRTADELIAHDLTSLYTYRISGELIKKTSIADLIGPDYRASVNTRFFYADGGKSLVFNVTGKDGIMAVYVSNLLTKGISRISTESLSVSGLFVTFDNRVFFSAASKPSGTSKIYVSDLKGKVWKISEQGTDPTAANK